MQSTLSRAVAVTALALVLGGGAGAQDISGYVGGSYFKTDIDDGPDFDGFTLEGAYFNTLGGNFNLQADGLYKDYDEGDDNLLAAQLHLFVRDSSSHAVGGFAAVLDSDEAETVWGVGAEGEVYNGQWTLGGVAGWFDSDDFDSLYGLCGYGRLYGSSSFLIEGRTSFANVDFGPGDIEAWSIGAGAEYMFTGAPISIRGGLDRIEQDDLDIEATRLTIGARYHFGSSGLMQRDREGAGQPGGTCVVNTVTP